jgi:hypothetical protein
MRTRNWVVILAIILVFSVTATAKIQIPASEQGKDKSKADNSPVIEKEDNNLNLMPPGLEKIVYIHYKKGFAKPSWAGGGEKESKCYDFLARGAKWKTLPVNYVIDPDNPDGLTEEFITSAIHAGAEEWDNHTSAELFGTYSIDYNASWDSDQPDGRNELVFGDYPEEGVIAVTVVWGYFSGPPSLREIKEFDVLFDTDFTWGDATIDPVMDLQNIATHEIGHGAGLDDLYSTDCSEQTMYGYSDYGETKKRDLASGDIAGIQELYGS